VKGAPATAEIVLRLAIIAVLCGAIGMEREARGQIAGLRTHVIVGLGAGLFTLVSAYGFSGVDPTRLAAQVVSGIGFLGGGVILRHGATVRGVTTAAALWISAAIGVAAAAGYYGGAVATTIVALLVLVGLRRLKPAVRRRLGSASLQLDVVFARGASMRSLLGELRGLGLTVEGLESEILDDGSERLRLDVRGAPTVDVDGILSALSRRPDVMRVDLGVLDSLDVVYDDPRHDDEDQSGLHLLRPRAHARSSSTRSATEPTTREAR
jgi:putative Mg2+ transporter-C (MgtC) family protein